MPRLHPTPWSGPSWLQRFYPGTAAFQRAVLVSVTALLLGLVAYSGANAVLRGNRARDAALRAEARCAAEKQTQDELLAKKSGLESAEGVRQEANRKGMVGVTEEVVRMALPAAPPAAPAAPAPAGTASTLDGLAPALMLLFGLAFLIGVALLLLRWRAFRRRRRPAGFLTPRSELRRRRPDFSDSV